jgi:hypothetical protein
MSDCSRRRPSRGHAPAHIPAGRRAPRPAAAAVAPPAIRARLQFGHRRQAFRPGAAQQLQQKRFGLVVLLVRGEQKIRVQRGKNALALAPRSRFDAGRVVARDLHVMECQFNRMRGAQPGAEIGPVVGMGRQAMVHMHGPQFEGMLIAQRQQACSRTTESSPPESPSTSRACGGTWRARTPPPLWRPAYLAGVSLKLPYARRRW